MIEVVIVIVSRRDGRRRVGGRRGDRGLGTLGIAVFATGGRPQLLVMPICLVHEHVCVDERRCLEGSLQYWHVVDRFRCRRLVARAAGAAAVAVPVRQRKGFARMLALASLRVRSHVLHLVVHCRSGRGADRSTWGRVLLPRIYARVCRRIDSSDLGRTRLLLFHCHRS